VFSANRGDNRIVLSGTKGTTTLLTPMHYYESTYQSNLEQFIFTRSQYFKFFFVEVPDIGEFVSFNFPTSIFQGDFPFRYALVTDQTLGIQSYAKFNNFRSLMVSSPPLGRFLISMKTLSSDYSDVGDLVVTIISDDSTYYGYFDGSTIFTTSSTWSTPLIWVENPRTNISYHPVDPILFPTVRRIQFDFRNYNGYSDVAYIKDIEVTEFQYNDRGVLLSRVYDDFIDLNFNQTSKREIAPRSQYIYTADVYASVLDSSQSESILIDLTPQIHYVSDVCTSDCTICGHY